MYVEKIENRKKELWQEIFDKDEGLTRDVVDRIFTDALNFSASQIKASTKNLYQKDIALKFAEIFITSDRQLVDKDMKRILTLESRISLAISTSEFFLEKLLESQQNI